MDDMRKYVCQPGSSFETAISSRLSVLNARNLARESCPDRVLFYEEEKMYAIGAQRTLKRLYVRKPNQKYVGVGWVINEDIDFCMICAKSFGFFLYRHHCRSCGNLVCDPCSPHSLVLVELDEIGEHSPQRVCIQCYWGQDPVHVARWRQNSEYFEDDDMQTDRNSAISTNNVNNISTTRSSLGDDKFVVLEDTSDSDSDVRNGNGRTHPNNNKSPTRPTNQQSVQQQTQLVPPPPPPTSNQSPRTVDGVSPLRNGGTVASELDAEHLKGSAIPPLAAEHTVTPTPGMCVKTKTKDGFKVFVNVCHHTLIPISLVTNTQQISIGQLYVALGAIRDTSDKKGEDSCKLVDVGVNSEKYKEFVEDGTKKEKMFLHILKVIESTLGESLDEDYKTPKTPRNYKGSTDVYPLTFKTRLVAAPSSSSSAADADNITPSKKLSVAESILAANSSGKKGNALLSRTGTKENLGVSNSGNNGSNPNLVRARELQEQQEAKEAKDKEAREKELREKEQRDREVQQQQRQAELDRDRERESQREAELAMERHKAERARKDKEEEDALQRQKVEAERLERQRQEEQENLERLRQEKERVRQRESLERREKEEAAAAAAVVEAQKQEAEKKRQQEQQRQEEQLQRENNERARKEREAADAALAAAAEAERVREREREHERELERARVQALADIEAAAAEKKRLAEQQLQQEQPRRAVSTDSVSNARSNSADSDDARPSVMQQPSSPTAAGATSAGAAAANDGADDEDDDEVEGEGRASTFMDDIIKVKPIPGVVLKTKTKKTGLKFFINLCHHELISPTTPSSSSSSSSSSSALDNLLVCVGEIREINDKSGESCLLVDAAINSKRFQYYMVDDSTSTMQTKDKLCLRVLKSVGKQLNETLDDDYKTPKTKNNYKQGDKEKESEDGSGVMVMDITAAVGTITSSQRRSLVDMLTGRNSGIASSGSTVGGIMSRLSSGSLGSKPTVELLPATNGVTYASKEEQGKWSHLLARGERVVAVGVVGKKNPVGLTQTRTLVLTDGPRLLYADPKTRAMKGEVECPDGSAPVAIMNNQSTIDVKTPQRVYRFIDTELGAKYWVDKINATFQQFK